MTAVDLDALDKLRGALAAALFQADTSSHLGLAGMSYEAAADALLPVVDRIANERAAAELRAAADAAHDEYSGWEAAAVVRARADALDPK